MCWGSNQMSWPVSFHNWILSGCLPHLHIIGHTLSIFFTHLHLSLASNLVLWQWSVRQLPTPQFRQNLPVPPYSGSKLAHTSLPPRTQGVKFYRVAKLVPSGLWWRCSLWTGGRWSSEGSHCQTDSVCLSNWYNLVVVEPITGCTWPGGSPIGNTW